MHCFARPCLNTRLSRISPVHLRYTHHQSQAVKSEPSRKLFVDRAEAHWAGSQVSFWVASPGRVWLAASCAVTCPAPFSGLSSVYIVYWEPHCYSLSFRRESWSERADKSCWMSNVAGQRISTGATQEHWLKALWWFAVAVAAVGFWLLSPGLCT